MDSKEMCEQRHELIRIFNGLSLPLQRQLLTVARIIDATRDIVLSEGKKKCVNEDLPSK